MLAKVNPRHLQIALILALLTALAYWRVLGCDFIRCFDDGTYVANNQHIKYGLTWKSFLWSFNIGYAANWHPLTWMSHMLDISIWGLNPLGHHLTNLVLHILNTLLLFSLLVRMTGSSYRPAFVAVLFAIHPLHVESVAWVAERKDVLSTFFMMLVMIFYHSYTLSPSLKRYVPVVLLFVLGLMAKPMLVSLPILLFLLDFWPLGRMKSENVKRLVLEKLPLAALALGSCAITFVAQSRGGAVGSLEVFSLYARVGNAVVAYSRYLLNMLWPAKLALFYPHPGDSLPVWQIAASLVFLAGVSFIAYRLRKSHQYLAMGWLWYVITLVPVIGLVQVGNQALADRYTYVSLVGIFVVIAWIFPEISGRRRFVLPVAAFLVTGALMACTWNYLGYWKDSKALVGRALAVTKNNYTMHNNYGVILKDQGDIEGAVLHYKESLRINPNHSSAHANLGNAYSIQGKVKEAIREYALAARNMDKAAQFYNNSGNAFLRAGQYEEAVESYEKALKIEPNFVDVHVNMGVALARLGRTDEAISYYSRALKINPFNPDAHNNLGNLLSERGEVDEAIKHYHKALSVRPYFGDAHFNLAIACFQKGDYAEAWDEVNLARKCGYDPHPGFIKALSEKMPEPN
jgi:tetratricopeptide (TPR) repeat protein